MLHRPPHSLPSIWDWVCKSPISVEMYWKTPNEDVYISPLPVGYVNMNSRLNRSSNRTLALLKSLPSSIEMLATAEICYRRAHIDVDTSHFVPDSGILIVRRVYRAIGLKLRSTHQSNPLHGRTMLNKWEKLWQVGLGFIDASNPVTLGWWKPTVPESPMYSNVDELTQ